ncbi:protein of unknown function [Ruminococcaceae bacterium BL-6]|nr:protein of unknown function [Ruminococcaceae bacterium BL-6]
MAAALADDKGSLLCMPLALCPIYAVQRNASRSADPGHSEMKFKEYQ